MRLVGAEETLGGVVCIRRFIIIISPAVALLLFILTSLLFKQVVYNVGLCICLYDITKLEDSYIFPGDGASHTKGIPTFWLT